MIPDMLMVVCLGWSIIESWWIRWVDCEIDREGYQKSGCDCGCGLDDVDDVKEGEGEDGIYINSERLPSGW